LCDEYFELGLLSVEAHENLEDLLFLLLRYLLNLMELMQFTVDFDKIG